MVDVCVVGGSFEACAIALSYARKGRITLLVCQQLALGGDMTHSLHPFAQKDSAAKTEGIAGLLCGHLSGAETIDSGRMKRELLHALESAGVTVLFGETPCGLLREKNHVCGVLLLGRGGLTAISAATVIDAREVAPETAQAQCATASYANFHPKQFTYALPEEMGGECTAHAAQQEGLGYLRFVFFGNVDSLCLRAKCREALAWLMPRHGEIARAQLLQLSDRPLPVSACIQTGALWHANDQLPGLLRKKWVAPVPLSISWLCAFEDALANEEVAPGTSAMPDSVWIDGHAYPWADLKPQLFSAQAVGDAWRITNPSILQASQDTTCDVLVVGGGTCGFPAAYASATAGARTVLAEAFPALGGTATIGGINRHFNGFRGGFTAQLDAMTTRMAKRIAGDIRHLEGSWHVESRKLTMEAQLQAAACEVWLETPFLHVIMENRRVDKVLLWRNGRIVSVKADTVIDATGEGVVAIAAGCDYYVGDPRGGNIQTVNQCEWQVQDGAWGINQDIGVMHPLIPYETSRIAHAAHRQSKGIDNLPYIGLRESVHVRCDASFTMADVIHGRRWPDGIVRCEGEFDHHGVQGSRFARAGVLPYHQNAYESIFPYGAAIAKHVDNLLIGGKAIGATKDAMCMMRMQPEQQNLGWALGKAAAMCAGNPRGVSIPALQYLVQASGGLLPGDTEVVAYDARLPSAVACLAQARPGDEEAAEDAWRYVISARREEALPLLTQESPTLWIAMACAWFGSAYGQDCLIETLNLLPTPNGCRLDREGRPIGGVVGKPDSYWLGTRIITLLGILRDDAGEGAIVRSMARTDAGGPPNTHIRLHWRKVPNEDRLLALCFAAERFASPRFIAPLERLLDLPYLHGYVQTAPQDADEVFIGAHLELSIARALARCGGRMGALRLASYLADCRPILACHAIEELRALFPGVQAESASQWRAIVEAAPVIAPVPWVRDLPEYIG